ncbi:cell wall hydrolase [Roseovarius halotolerans]|uniref:Spore cortex-lytic enzyme n=1 Tax=Roseovarius halotolerans TaxID=505353 RepID=A0A1X6ZF10_9RHOB|nr:cell wall hydrolase [Roseovarius halotolerans]RKT30779.1 cell wall hydrolase [Roseovarius halotolerans]SLN49339.1 Spore cortex-lytic enzyme precursor [Roseovarius halotolerans]
MFRVIVMCCMAFSTAAFADTPVKRLFEQERLALGQISGERRASYLTQPETDVEYSRDWLAGMDTVKGGEEWQCLAEALYFEARGESVRGQFAVAEVIMNRVDSVEFPDSICGVVHQGTGRKYACQFTYTCDGHEEVVSEKAAFRQVGKVAGLMVAGAPRRLTDGATHYHTRAVNPRWARSFPRTATIGVHHFYRMPTRLSSN